jgi:hypothetical protein
LTAPLRSPGLETALLRRLRQRHEILARDRVLVLLSQKLLLDEQVYGRRIGACILALKQTDRVDVLLAAEHQLFFFFSLGRVLPDRHRRRHDDGHDGNADNEGSHGVPLISPTVNGFALTR